MSSASIMVLALVSGLRRSNPLPLACKVSRQDKALSSNFLSGVQSRNASSNGRVSSRSL